jgi:hypothetical protein
MGFGMNILRLTRSELWGWEGWDEVAKWWMKTTKFIASKVSMMFYFNIQMDETHQIIVAINKLLV